MPAIIEWEQQLNLNAAAVELFIVLMHDSGSPCDTRVVIVTLSCTQNKTLLENVFILCVIDDVWIIFNSVQCIIMESLWRVWLNFTSLTVSDSDRTVFKFMFLSSWWSFIPGAGLPQFWYGRLADVYSWKRGERETPKIVKYIHIEVK